MKSLAIAFVVVSVIGSSLRASPVAYQKIKVGHVWLHVITADVNDPQVKVTAGIAQKGRGSSEAFSSIVSRTRPKAAITGTFFDTRSLLPIGDIAIDGQVVHKGYFRTAIGVSSDNKARMLKRAKGCIEDRWNGFDMVMCGGITLIKNGRISLAPRAEGFRDKALFRPNRRTAVAITGTGKMLMVSANGRIYLKDLAHALIKLGAVDAAALDGGSSTAMYYSGRLLSKPARKLTNVLLVYDKSEAYLQARAQLAPTILGNTAGVRENAKPVSVMLAAVPRVRRPFSTNSLLDFADIRIAAPLIREPEIKAAE